MIAYLLLLTLGIKCGMDELFILACGLGAFVKLCEWIIDKVR